MDLDTKCQKDAEAIFNKRKALYALDREFISDISAALKQAYLDGVERGVYDMRHELD